ncbi:MAG: hypothetical protein WC959_07660 [Kiritimatiellales bacterium]
MKKMIVLVLAALVAAAGFSDEFAARLEAAKNTGDQQAVLALADEFPEKVLPVYRTATVMLPANERIAFAESIEDSSLRLPCLIVAHRKGKACNDLLREFYSSQRGGILSLHRFDPASETIDGCISFYELVLKNVELKEHTQTALSKIKGELLKLKAQ